MMAVMTSGHHVKVHVIYEEVAVFFSYLERNGPIPIAFLVVFV